MPASSFTAVYELYAEFDCNPFLKYAYENLGLHAHDTVVISPDLTHTICDFICQCTSFPFYYPNTTYVWGLNALHTAILLNDKFLVQQLINEHGLEVNLQAGGVTSLGLAAHLGHTSLMRDWLGFP